MFNPNRSDRLKDLVNIIKQKTHQQAVVIEGVKDRRALEGLGLDVDFFLLSRNKKSLHERAEEIAQTHDQAFLFLDLDPKGRQLTDKMKRYLHQSKVKVNTGLGRKLLKLVSTDKVEGLTSAIRKL